MAASVSAIPADPEAEQTAWDLEQLVDGEGPEGVAAPAGRGAHARRGVRRALCGQAGASSTAPACAEAMQRAGRDPRARRAALAPTRRSTSPRTPPIRRAARSCSARRSAGPRSRRRCCSSSSSGRRSADERVRELLDADGRRTARISTSAAITCAARAAIAITCSSEPEEKILAEKALTGASRLVAAVRGADLGDRGRAARRRRGRWAATRRAGRWRRGPAGERVALDLALSRLALPDRELRRTTAEAVTAALAPGLRTRAFLFNTLLADKSTDDRLRRYASWLAARNLVKRSQRRVGAGADRGGPRAL